MKARCIAIFLSLVLIPFAAYTAPLTETVNQAQALPISKINLNKADLIALTGSFKGIGAKRAQAIIAYREEHKRFNSIEQLAEVKGLGPTFVAKNLNQLKARFSLD